MRKLRMLVLSDSPTGNTGFSKVSLNILKYLTKDFDIDVVGINQREIYYDQVIYPFRIFSDDETGDFGIAKACRLLSSNRYDIFFTINNLAITEQIQNALFSLPLDKVPYWVAYVPIEQDYLVPSQYDFLRVEKTRINKLVLYHPLAKELLCKYLPSLESRVEWIPHGINTEEFYPLSKKEIKDYRKKAFGLNDNDFLITNVNNNQWRKNPFATIYSFLLAKAIYSDDKYPLKLYLHMPIDGQAGNLRKMIEVAKELTKQYGNTKLSTKDIILPPDNFNNNLSIKELNNIYNASDLVITTSFGEGWGFSTTEAMATKTPVLAPCNTSFRYILDNDRGNFLEVGDYEFPYANSAYPRIGISYKYAAESLYDLKRDLTYGDNTVNKAYDWVRKLTWKKISQKWLNLFNYVKDL